MIAEVQSLGRRPHSPTFLARSVFRLLCPTGEESRAVPASDDLIQARQNALVEDEEAADVIMLAMSRLSYEQLQVVQVRPLRRLHIWSYVKP